MMRAPALATASAVIGTALMFPPFAGAQAGSPGKGLLGNGGQVFSQKQNTRVKPDGSNLFQAVHDGFARTMFTGVRTHSMFKEGRLLSRYRETVIVKPSKDGALRFSLGLDRVLSGPHTKVQHKAHELHAGFLFHYRDFRIHDIAAARRNYRVTAAGGLRRFGRNLLLFNVVPLKPRRSSYLVFVDSASATVLDQVEYAPNGGVVCSLSYDALLFGAGVLAKGKEWWKPWISVQQHVNLASAARTAGFDSRPPTKIADGFGLHRIQTATRERTWHVVLVYTDGIDTRFVIQTPSIPTAVRAAAPVLAVQRYQVGPVTQYLVSHHKGLQHLVVGTFYGKGVPRLLRDLLK
ncbi:MAG: hypothetical protein CMJ85_00340 [Planctomycetes bacterium]|nr:hypothetical protein [Planctomycetota bacterium]